jgi:hypothetical protein
MAHSYDTQEQDHRRRSYTQEFKALLDKHGCGIRPEIGIWTDVGVAPLALEDPKPRHPPLTRVG